MTRLGIPTFLLMALLLGACGENPAPPSPVRVESAGEAMRKDNDAIAKRLAEQKAAVEDAYRQQQALAERRQLVDSLAAIGKRWFDAITEAAGAVRSKVAPIIKKFEALKGEAATLAVNECTDKARAMLVSSMTTAIDAYAQFNRETGAASEAVQQKVQQASTLFYEFEKQLASCR